VLSLNHNPIGFSSPNAVLSDRRYRSSVDGEPKMRLAWPTGAVHSVRTKWLAIIMILRNAACNRSLINRNLEDFLLD
jgi:hypothetical protein